MSTSLSLPPIAVLASAAAELVVRTTDSTEIAMLNKAIYHLQRGAEIVVTTGGFLIPSANKSDVYRVTHMGTCSCKGGTTHGHCYHTRMITIIEEAQTRAISPSDRIAARRKALELINELFQ